MSLFKRLLGLDPGQAPTVLWLITHQALIRRLGIGALILATLAHISTLLDVHILFPFVWIFLPLAPTVFVILTAGYRMHLEFERKGSIKAPFALLRRIPKAAWVAVVFLLPYAIIQARTGTAQLERLLPADQRGNYSEITIQTTQNHTMLIVDGREVRELNAAEVQFADLAFLRIFSIIQIVLLAAGTCVLSAAPLPVRNPTPEAESASGWYHINGDLDPWPDRKRMAELLTSAGFSLYVGRFSIRIEDYACFGFHEYGGDLGDPVVEADSEELEPLMVAARRVSDVLTSAGIRHRFEIYDESDQLVGYLHHKWPNSNPE